MSNSYVSFIQISDFAIQTLCSALDQNGSLKSLSVENNRVTPDTIADLFESIASPNNGLLELRVACQAQESMGNRVEGRIADAIMKNPRLMKVGITLEFQVRSICLLMVYIITFISIKHLSWVIPWMKYYTVNIFLQ